jgi:hypothetical protein
VTPPVSFFGVWASALGEIVNKNSMAVQNETKISVYRIWLMTVSRCKGIKDTHRAHPKIITKVIENEPGRDPPSFEYNGALG